MDKLVQLLTNERSKVSDLCGCYISTQFLEIQADSYRQAQYPTSPPPSPKLLTDQGVYSVWQVEECLPHSDQVKAG